MLCVYVPIMQSEVWATAQTQFGAVPLQSLAPQHDIMPALPVTGGLKFDLRCYMVCVSRVAVPCNLPCRAVLGVV